MFPMPTRRFYCEHLPASGGQVSLDREQAEHARKSLRLTAGDVIELFDGSGGTALAVITELHSSTSGGTLTATIQSSYTTPPLSPALTLAVAIPKGSRADTLIDQSTQLGVSRLIPLITARSVVEPRPSGGKLDRFRRIIIEACKQSRRPHLMTLADPTPLPNLLKTSHTHDARFIADLPDSEPRCPQRGFPDMQSLHPPTSLHPTLLTAQRILVLIGPEGGWTDDERLATQNAGFAPLTLAPYTLRVETAALAAAAIIRATRGLAS